MCLSWAEGLEEFVPRIYTLFVLYLNQDDLPIFLVWLCQNFVSARLNLSSPKKHCGNAFSVYEEEEQFVSVVFNFRCYEAGFEVYLCRHYTGLYKYCWQAPQCLGVLAMAQQC